MRAISVLLLILTGACLFAGCSGAVESADKKAADFSLQDINNQTVRLSDYSNKVVILDFFATWCPPCKSEIPDFMDLLKDYGDKGLVVIGISLDKDGIDEVKKFVMEQSINYPVMLDDGIVSNSYGPIDNIPTTYIIDKTGNIIEKIIGSRNKDYFEKAIKPLL